MLDKFLNLNKYFIFFLFYFLFSCQNQNIIKWNLKYPDYTKKIEKICRIINEKIPGNVSLYFIDFMPLNDVPISIDDLKREFIQKFKALNKTKIQIVSESKINELLAENDFTREDFFNEQFVLQFMKKAQVNFVIASTIKKMEDIPQKRSNISENNADNFVKINIQGSVVEVKTEKIMTGFDEILWINISN